MMEQKSYTYNFIIKNDKNRRHTKLASWLKNIEKTGPYSVRFNLKEYANLYNDLYRILELSEGNWDVIV